MNQRNKESSNDYNLIAATITNCVTRNSSSKSSGTEQKISCYCTNFNTVFSLNWEGNWSTIWFSGTK